MQRDIAVTFAEQMEEIDREIAIRKRFYPQWIQDGRLKDIAGAKQLARLMAVKETMQALHQYRTAVPQAFFSMRYEKVDV